VTQLGSLSKRLEESEPSFRDRFPSAFQNILTKVQAVGALDLVSEARLKSGPPKFVWMIGQATTETSVNCRPVASELPAS